MIIGTVLSGALSDRYGRLYILVFFLSLFCVSSLICAFSTSIYLFLLGRFLQGIGSAAGVIILISLVADRFEGADYKKFISYILITLGLSHGVAPMMGIFILNYFDWKAIFYFLTLCGVLSLLLVFSVGIKKEIHSQKLKDIFREYMTFIKDPFFLHYCLIIGALYGAFNAIIIISPYIVRIHYGWTITDFFWVGLAFAVGDSVGAYLHEFFAKQGSRKIVLIGLFLATISLLLLLIVGLPDNALGFLGLATLFILGSNITAACLTTNAVKVNPQFTGIASSFVYLAKFMMCSLVLILVIFLPNELITINFFILFSLILSGIGYLKIRRRL